MISARVHKPSRKAEGPIIEDRLYALYARAAELGRVYGPVRQKFERALQTALEAKHLIASRETFGAHDERVITLPDQPPVSVREAPGPCTKSREARSPR